MTFHRVVSGVLAVIILSIFTGCSQELSREEYEVIKRNVVRPDHMQMRIILKPYQGLGTISHNVSWRLWSELESGLYGND